MQSVNIYSILVTLEVSKRDKSKEVKDLHPWNIDFIFFDSNLIWFGNINDFNFSQFLKRPLVGVFLVVLKLEILR